MAAACDLPGSKVERILESWQAGESERAPALVRLIDGGPERGIWTLAEPHRLELELIQEGGERRRRGAENGRLGASRKMAVNVAKRHRGSEG
jgi:hypothetical protein